MKTTVFDVQTFKFSIFWLILWLDVFHHVSTAFVPFVRKPSSRSFQNYQRVSSTPSFMAVNGEASQSQEPQPSKFNLKLLLIDHYDSFTYNLYDMLAQLTVEPPLVLAKDAYDSWPKEVFDNLDGIILSPGPGTPQAQPLFSKQAIKLIEYQVFFIFIA